MRDVVSERVIDSLAAAELAGLSLCERVGDVGGDSETDGSRDGDALPLRVALGTSDGDGDAVTDDVATPDSDADDVSDSDASVDRDSEDEYDTDGDG